MARRNPPTSPQTKRKADRRRRALWYPIRLMGMGVSGILGAFLLFQLFIKVAAPYKLGDEEARRVVALRERFSKQEKINTELDATLKYLESDEGAETQARRNGYHRKGEAVYMLDKDAITSLQSSATTLPSKQN